MKTCPSHLSQGLPREFVCTQGWNPGDFRDPGTRRDPEGPGREGAGAPGAGGRRAGEVAGGRGGERHLWIFYFRMRGKRLPGQAVTRGRGGPASEQAQGPETRRAHDVQRDAAARDSDVTPGGEGMRGRPVACPSIVLVVVTGTVVAPSLRTWRHACSPR